MQIPTVLHIIRVGLIDCNEGFRFSGALVQILGCGLTAGLVSTTTTSLRYQNFQTLCTDTLL